MYIFRLRHIYQISCPSVLPCSWRFPYFYCLLLFYRLLFFLCLHLRLPPPPRRLLLLFLPSFNQPRKREKNDRQKFNQKIKHKGADTRCDFFSWNIVCDTVYDIVCEHPCDVAKVETSFTFARRAQRTSPCERNVALAVTRCNLVFATSRATSNEKSHRMSVILPKLGRKKKNQTTKKQNLYETKQ